VQGQRTKGYRPGMELWHNPRCSKSRAAKAILDEREVTYVERRYLEDPPDAALLDRVLRALGKEPWEITRMGEAPAKTLGLRDKAHERMEWIAILAANPVLIERPILIVDDQRAVVGRPPELVSELLSDLF
jgi:arsenate reductase (glutaredoxin)